MVFNTLLGGILFLGGIFFSSSFVEVVGLIFAGILLAFILFRKGKVEIPHGFLLYGIFLLAFLASIFWSVGPTLTFNRFLLFLSAGAFWLLAFNLKSSIDFEKIIYFLLFSYTALYAIYYFTGLDPLRAGGIYLPSSSYHHHLGDLWSVGVVVLLAKYLKERKPSFWIFILFGLFMIIVSLSRSALASLAGGVFLLAFFGVQKRKKFSKKVIVSVLVLTGLAFIGLGFIKPTLYSRPYFVQSVVGFFHYPFGVGVGNFAEISFDPRMHIWGFKDIASAAHGIIFELLSGMGVLAITFYIWLYRVLRRYVLTSGKNVLLKATSITLFVNFFFDTTYFIPVMLWLWFITLGMLSKKKATMKLGKLL